MMAGNNLFGLKSIFLIWSIILCSLLPAKAQAQVAAVSLVSQELAQQEDGQEEQVGSRHICSGKLMRNGNCDKTTLEKKGTDAKRVAVREDSGAKGNKRIQEVQAAARKKRPAASSKSSSAAAGNRPGIKPASQAKTNAPTSVKVAIKDLPLESPKIGITIWRLREARSSDPEARLLTHPNSDRQQTYYTARRVEGEPTLNYGEKVRLGIESPQDGFLYVIDRELYDDGTMSDGYIIFPTARTRGGDNRIQQGRPVEMPALSDNPIYFEAKPTGIEKRKTLVGEVLSVLITRESLRGMPAPGDAPLIIPSSDIDRLEGRYAGRVEVFELEGGADRPYTPAERSAADYSGGRGLTHGDPLPQTVYLVEDKKTGGVLVTLVLRYTGR